MNLFEETIKELKEHGKTIDDIRWVGCKDYSIFFEDFIELARNTNYDDGYGAPQVCIDLLVVGKDFWLERHEYDGSEWWEYKSIPVLPFRVNIVKRLVAKGIGWETLEEANNE